MGEDPASVTYVRMKRARCAKAGIRSRHIALPAITTTAELIGVLEGLSDVEWEFVRPLLPASLRGRKRLDDRTVLNGIVWKFRTGVGWRDVPERYGPWATLHTRLRRWALDGTFDRMLRAAQTKADAAGGIDWLVSVDSTAVRAHQHAAGARKGGIPALGRSRGGLTSKIHLACDALGRPLAFTVTGGNTNASSCGQQGVPEETA